MKRALVGASILVFLVLLAVGLGLPKKKKAVPEKTNPTPAAVQSIQFVYSGRAQAKLPELQKCSDAIINWLEEKLPGRITGVERVEIDYRETVDFPTATSEKGAIAAGFDVPFFLRGKTSLWVYCKRHGTTLSCKIGVKGQKLSDEELQTYAVIGVADALHYYYVPRTAEAMRKRAAEWGYEFFKPLIRKEGGKWVTNCGR